MMAAPTSLDLICTLPSLGFIYLGDTGPVLEVRPSVLDEGVVIDANWSCHIRAIYKDGSEAIAKTEITWKTSDDLYFIAALTPTQTETIDIPNNLAGVTIEMIVEVANLTVIPPFKKEIHYDVSVCEQGII